MYLAHLSKLAKVRLADVLVEEGVLERDRVEEAQAEQEETGKQLGAILVEREILDEYSLAKLITHRYSLPYLEIVGYSTRREVISLLPLDFCERNTMLPLDQFGELLTLAVTEMPDQELIDSIVAQTKLTPCLFVALRRGVLDALGEEKKRGAKQAGNAAARVAAAASAAAAAAALAPAGAATASPAATVVSATVVSAAPTMTRPKSAKPDLPLPEFDLPTVSMKLVGSSAAKVASAPQRVTVVKEPAVAGKPGAALTWMDTASGAQPGESDPSRPKINKYAVPPAPAATAAGTKAPAPGTVNAPAATSGKPGAGAWQTIFEAGEDTVRKTKAK